MHLPSYKLRKKPFQIASDPEFLWMGEKQREALASLKYGILDNKGFLLLTGEIGTGKTTLINSLVRNLGEEVIIARVHDPEMNKLDFLNFISHAIKMEKEFKRKSKCLIHFSKFLNDACADDKMILLIIDEAQRLKDLLEEIRLLSNIEKSGKKLLNIFLIGQKELNHILNLDSWRQRITINHSLEPLNDHATGELIRHRLRIAGAQYDIFSSGPILAVHAISDGIPRRVNICDRCMVTGFVKEAQTITAEIDESCAEVLNLPCYSDVRSTGLPRTEMPNEPEIRNETPEPNDSLTTPDIPASAWLTAVYVGIFVTVAFSAAYIFQTRSGMEIFHRAREYGIKAFNDIIVPNRISETSSDARPYGKLAVATPAGLSFRPDASLTTVEATREMISPPSIVSVTAKGENHQRELRKAESKAILEAVAQIIENPGKAAENPKAATVKRSKKDQEHDPFAEETSLEKTSSSGMPPENDTDGTEIIDFLLTKRAK